jgi:uncharacterized protein YdhG (YjbR/CyaY superfamily)
MRSDAATVDAYLAELPADRREQLTVLRGLCVEHLPAHDEVMRWGMPAYVRGDRADVAFASQARHIALYVMQQPAVAANAERLAGLDMGKGCLRLKPSAAIDVDLVRSLLVATAACDGDPC